MGQVVTGGRLEITALGDTVNEAARIEQVARDGEVLVSKALLERLADDDAQVLGIDPPRCTYEILGDRADGHDKTERDAGTLAVTYLFADRCGPDAPPPVPALPSSSSSERPGRSG